MTAQSAFNYRSDLRRNHGGHADVMNYSAHVLSAGWRLGALQYSCPARSGYIAAAMPWLAQTASPSAASTSATSATSGSCSHRRLGACGPASMRRPVVSCTAYGRGSGSGGSDSNYYELLGVDPDCDEEDIRAAFRRRAKELHPDVNKEEGATEAFVQLSRAYEVLSDQESRRQYDITHRTRRLNFFRDVVEEEDEEGGRRSPFRWSQVGRRQGGGGLRPDDEDGDGGRRRAGWVDDDDEEDEDGEGEEDEGEGWQRGRSQEEVLQELAKFMSGPGSLRAWQSGRMDPWGTSTSDTWFRQVERQTRSPYGPARPGYGSPRDDDDEFGAGGGREWDPSRRAPGWSPPGRGGEWSHPRRQWDEEDRRGGGPGRQGGGGGGDFRRPFKI
ncbi:hypothetical protein PLESTB_001387300 [Pleodorina starrii]|uniref:J domain-containing protein n=1 Tax=Pleodorina starrii TaxID=330485 RepID=A0A9W6F705_9CHLO|nr:hypothetical protein PLESTB_001387300 [Pleodorina starrii]